MSIDQVCEVFEQISQTRSRKEKEALLYKLSVNPVTNDVAAKLLFNALDWYTHFGVSGATIPEPEGRIPGYTDTNLFFGMLSTLKERGSKDRGHILNILDCYRPLTAKWLRRVLIKDLQMGVQATTVNKIWYGLARTFECQLADTLDDLDKLVYPVLVEPKIDGVRAVFIADGVGPIRCLSRSGNVLFNVEPIARELKLLQMGSIFGGKPVVFDGELFVGTLHKTLSLVRSQKQIDISAEGLRYNIFDFVDYSEWVQQKATIQQHERSQTIKLINEERWLQFVTPTIQSYGDRLAYGASDVEALYEQDLAAGHEGSMIKDLSAPYLFTRSQAWSKYKPFDIDEFEITGYYQGQGRNSERLGGFTVEVGEGITTDVGGGYSDVQRDEFWAARQDYVSKKIKVKYKQKTPDGKLREPVFLGFA